MNRCQGWLLAAVFSLAGCSATVSIATGEGSDDESGGAGAGGEPCIPSPPPPGTPEVDLRVDGPGSVVEERLHVAGTLDGTPGYFVAKLEQEAIWIGEAPSGLTGSPRWTEIAASRHARLDATEAIRIDVLDAAFPDAPTILREIEIEGGVPAMYRETFATDGPLLYFCHQPDPDAAAELVAVDLSAASPAPTPTGIVGACHMSGYDRSVAAGPLFVVWSEEEGSLGGSVGVRNVLTGQSIASFGFAGNGIHNYGSIVGVASDGARVVVSPENDDWMLLFDDDETGGNNLPYVSFTPDGPKKLLVVVDAIAYFAVPDGVVAYDVGDIPSPTLSDARPTADWDPMRIDLVAATTESLFVHDAEGRVWRVPRHVTAPVEPARIYRGEPPVVVDPCSE